MKAMEGRAMTPARAPLAGTLARSRRSFVLQGASAISALGLLAGCGAGERTSAGGVTREPVRLQMFNQSGAQKDVEDWQKMLAPFTQKYPNVTFDTTGAAAGPNGLLDKALAMGAAGTPPDFTYSVTRNGPTLFTSGLTQDLTPLVRRERIDLKDVPKGMVENMEWQGKLMALPYDPGYAFIQYNKSLFEKVGVPDPGALWRQKKWDWDTFVNTVAAVSRAQSAESQQAGFWIRTWEGDYLTIFRSLGGDTLSKDRSRFTLGDGPGIAALGRWAELATRHRAAPPDKTPPGEFVGGQLAMMSSHPGNITTIQRQLRDSGQPWSWDVVPHPAPLGKKPVPVLFTNGLYLWKGTKQEPTTVEVLKFLMQDEQMLEYGKLTGRDPARSTLMADHVKNLGIPQSDPKSWLQVYQELTPLVQGVPWTVNYVEWHTVLQQEVLTPVGKGEKSPQEAVSAAGPKISAILARK
jgi:multiple sugar transport system substrate-binding protein